MKCIFHYIFQDIRKHFRNNPQEKVLLDQVVQKKYAGIKFSRLIGWQYASSTPKKSDFFSIFNSCFNVYFFRLDVVHSVYGIFI